MFASWLPKESFPVKSGFSSIIFMSLRKVYVTWYISYMIQEIGTNKINLFFGKPECMEAMRHIITRPLNQLTAEEDFILGTMLGYDLCQQCKRYCNKKRGIKIAV